MARPHQLMRDYQRRHRKATSDAMKRHAKARQCPMCERKSALLKHECPEFVMYKCRWCGHEVSHIRGLATS